MESEKKEEHHKEEHKVHKAQFHKKLNLYYIFVGLTILLGIILILNIFFTFSLNQDLKKTSEAIKESLKPAKIEITLVKNSKCVDCFDISAVLRQIKSANVNVTKERVLEFDSKEGKEAVSKYKIEKLPNIVITGEIDKISIQGLENKENALMLTRLEPPYTDAATGKIEGKVSLYILNDGKCAECNDLITLINQVKGAGIKIAEEKKIERVSEEGKSLIKKYNIGFVPTIIMSKDAALYSIMQQAWPQVGTKESDGSYVLRLVNPPFINLTTEKLRGLVDIVYLTDKSCTECYDVNLHRQILVSPQSFAMRLAKEEKVDISDAKGKELVAKYNITQVPTIILSNEAGAYPSSQALRQFFTVEKDDSYVFRRVSVVGTYKDLTANQVVKVEQQSQE